MSWYCPEVSEGSTGNYVKSEYAFRTPAFRFDLVTFEAYSFDWWQFVKVVGNTIYFNDYNYSNYTGNHQYMAANILKLLDVENKGFKIIRVRYHLGLNNLGKQIDDYKWSIKKLNELINKKGTHKSKNEERKKQIRKLNKRIWLATKLKEHFDNAPDFRAPKEWVAFCEEHAAKTRKEKKLQRIIKRLAGDAYMAKGA